MRASVSITLGMLAALGMRDVLAMGAIRTLLAATINVAAVVTFIWAGAVLWPQCVLMIAGALTGGWFGAHLRRKPTWKKNALRGDWSGVGDERVFFYYRSLRLWHLRGSICSRA